MRSPLTYSIKAVDEELKRKRLRWERKLSGNYEGQSFWEIINQRLDQRIQEQQYDWIIDSLRDFWIHYTSNADYYLQIDIDAHKAKENNYLAALTGELIYRLLERGFSHHIFDSGMPYDFKKKNFTYTRNAILANEPELALRIASEDTLEGALLLQDYERAQALLPENPEDLPKYNETRQCMWAIAHGNEKIFNNIWKRASKCCAVKPRFLLLPLTLGVWRSSNWPISVVSYAT